MTLTRPEIPELVLADALRNDIAFFGLVGERIFHQIIPEGRGIKYPSVVIRVVNSSQRGLGEGNKVLMESSIQFTIEDDEFLRCKLAANRMFAAVNGFLSADSRPVIQRCKLQDGGETDDPILRQDGKVIYGVSQTYSVRWER